VTLPPLRARKGDLPGLVSHFIEKYAQAYGKELHGLAPGTLNALLKHDWPGNIRELENAIERAALLAERAVVSADDLRLGDAAQGTSMSRESAVVRIPPTGIPLEDVERQALTEALKMANWVQKDAADLLSISPRVMNYKIKTLRIELPKRRVIALAG
jgi:two-component system NtrC family response regulator